MNLTVRATVSAVLGIAGIGLRGISVLGLVAFGGALTAGSGAWAQQAIDSGTSAVVLQEVVVTAQKREEKLHDVPMGVTAITSEELQKQQLVSLEDLQSKVPGLSLTAVQPGETRLTLRGQNVGGIGSTVTTYIDDTPFGSSNALANGFFFTGDFDTWDLQRVEVLRGPQGTLYGAGSEGGLLKYVTNPPDPTKFAAAVQAGGEDVAHGEAAGSGKGMINLPIGDRAAFRLSGYYEGLPGYVNDPSLGEKNINRGYRDGVRAALLVNLTDNLSIRLNAFGQDLHTDGTPNTDVVGAGNLPLTPPANQLEPQNGNFNQQRFINEPDTFKYRIYSGKLNWNSGWGTFTSITSYGTTEQNGISDVTSVAPRRGLGQRVRSAMSLRAFSDSSPRPLPARPPSLASPSPHRPRSRSGPRSFVLPPRPGRLSSGSSVRSTRTSPRRSTRRCRSSTSRRRCTPLYRKPWAVRRSRTFPSTPCIASGPALPK